MADLPAPATAAHMYQMAAIEELRAIRVALQSLADTLAKTEPEPSAAVELKEPAAPKTTRRRKTSAKK